MGDEEKEVPHENVFQIYEHLLAIADKMHDEGDANVAGFDQCLWLLHFALKKNGVRNAHLENTQLKRALKAYEDKHNEFVNGKLSIIQKNKMLQDELAKLKLEIERLKK